MRRLSQSVVRSIRISVHLDKIIQDIAQLEERTVSNIIQRFLNDGVNNYLKDRPEFYDELKDLNLTEKQRLINQLNYELGNEE